jgi:proteasome lid subunit RPN8/RPN11
MNRRRRQLVAVPHDLAKIYIMRPVYETIRHLALESDVEICGGLYGYVSESKLIITHSRACRNFDHSKTSFVLDVEELTALPADLAEAGGLAGIYHSHVDEPAQISPTDYYFLGLARWVWLIMGKSADTSDFEMHCLGRVKSTIEEIAYVVIDEADS